MKKIAKKQNYMLSIQDLSVLCKHKRKELGLSMTAAAKEAYVSPATFSKIENIRGNISLGVRIDILRWLGRL